MANFVKNELLCFVQNKFGNYAAQNIQGVIVTFYEENEIVEAKKDLHEILVDMLGDDVVPRFKPRNAGDSKKRLDTEDLIKLFVLSDEKHTALPTFVAVNLNRIPSMKATDLDLSVMVNRMEMLQNSLSSVHMQLDDLRSNNVKLDLKMEELRNTTKTGLNAPVHSKSTESKAVSSFSCDPDVLTVRLPSLDEPSSNPNASVKAKSFVDVVKSASQRHEPWMTVERKQKKKLNIYGTKEGKEEVGLNAVKKFRTWHLYVGNLAPTTSVEQVNEYLHVNGVESVACETLSKYDDWNRNSIALHVEVSYEDKDKVMNPSFWDKGVRIRQWFFKRNSAK